MAIGAVGYLVFMMYKRLKSGNFKPWQLQERQVRLGVFDPITQVRRAVHIPQMTHATFIFEKRFQNIATVCTCKRSTKFGNQASAIFFCNMADDFTLRDAKDFIHYLQQNTPQLHYGSLAPAFVTSKLALRSKMRNAGTGPATS